MRALLSSALIAATLLIGCAELTTSTPYADEERRKRNQEHAERTARQEERQRKAYVAASTASEKVKQAILRREVCMEMSIQDVLMSLGEPGSRQDSTVVVEGHFAKVTTLNYPQVTVHFMNGKIDSLDWR